VSEGSLNRGMDRGLAVFTAEQIRTLRGKLAERAAQLHLVPGIGP